MCFNYEHVGYLSKWSTEHLAGLPAKYLLQRKNVTVGFGRDTFERATQLVQNFTLTNSLGWVRVVAPPADTNTLGSVIATISKFYCLPVWSVNPCRIVSIVRNTAHTRGQIGNKLIGFSQISFSTLYGHLLAGEEALRVYMVRNCSEDTNGSDGKKIIMASKTIGEGKVVFEIVSYSTGSNWLGCALLPLMRPLQQKFIKDHCRNVHLLLNPPSMH